MLIINNSRTTRARSINRYTFRKLIEYSLKTVLIKAMLTPTAFEISDSKSILSLAQLATGSERVNVSVKNQKNIRNLLKLLEKSLTYKNRRFSLVFNFFWFRFNSFSTKKLKKINFWDAINNLRITRAKSINLDTIRKLIGYSLKTVKIKAMLQALARIAPYMDLSKRKILMNAFLNWHFSYCPLVWMCHSRSLNNKINGLHERCLRLIYNDKQLTFEELLEKMILSKYVLEICKLSPLGCKKSWMVVLLKLWRRWSGVQFASPKYLQTSYSKFILQRHRNSFVFGA